MWLPIGTQPVVMPGGDRLDVRGSRWMSLIARLAPGSSREQARAELDSTIEQMRTTWASQGRYIDHRAAVFPLDNSPNGGVSVLRPVLLILMAVAAIVLLITCANLAGLLLARASARQREMAIRLSMGAGRWRIVQQLLVEGVVLAGLGSVAALVALRWTSGLLIGFAPPSELPIHLDVAVDAPRAVVHGGRRRRHRAAVRAGAGGPGRAVGSGHRRCANPARPAAASAVTGCAARWSPRRWRCRSRCSSAPASASAASTHAARMTPGFQAEGVVVGWLDLFSAGYTAEEGRAFYARVLERVRALPGVESVTLSRRIPLGFIGGSFTRRHRRGPHASGSRSAGRRPQQRRSRLRDDAADSDRRRPRPRRRTTSPIGRAWR